MVTDEVAVEVLRVKSEISPLRSFENGRLWLSKPIAYAILRKYPTLFQTCPEITGPPFHAGRSDDPCLVPGAGKGRDPVSEYFNLACCAHYTMRRLAVVTLILFGIAVLLCVAPVIASDCGCGGLPDNGPPDGWDTPGSFSGGGGSDTGGGGSDSGADPGSGDSSGGDQAGGDSGTSDSGASDSNPDGGSDGSSYSAGDSDSYSGGGNSISGSGSAEDAALLVSRARTYLQQGDYDASLEAFDDALSADHYLMAAWMGKGEVETRLGAYDNAVAAYGQAARIDPGDADPWVGKGNAYLAAGDYEQAIASFDKALLIHPGLADALESRASAEYLKATVLAAPVEISQDTANGSAGEEPDTVDVTGTPMVSEPPEGNEEPGDVVSVSVPGSAPSMLPMLVVIMAFAAIAYRRRDH